MPTLTWIQGQATGTVTFDDMKSAKLGLSSCGAKFWDHMDIKVKINPHGALGRNPTRECLRAVAEYTLQYKTRVP